MSGRLPRRKRAMIRGDLPRFLKPRRRSPGRGRFLADSAAQDAEGGGSVPSGRQLSGIRMVGQQSTNWCWSAVAQTVIDFLDGVTPSQAEIATAHIANGVGAVCQAGAEDQNSGKCATGGQCAAHCNDFHRVSFVLDEHGHFDSILSNLLPPSFDQIVEEINSDRPVVCRVEWEGGDISGHFILATGWTIDSDGNPSVHVHDPRQNESGEVIAPRILPYETFASNYTLMTRRGEINFSYRVR